VSLLALLTDRLAPGVWRLDHEPNGLGALAAGLGWTVRQFRVVDDKAELISALGTAVGVPDHVRGNWDSLADGLTDIAWDSERRLLVVADRTVADEPAVDGAETGAHVVVLTSVLNDAAAYWNRHGAVFQVVWIGEGSAPQLADVEPISVRRSERAGPIERPEQEEGSTDDPVGLD